MVVLFITLRPRSGVTIAVNELISVEEWTSLMIPTDLIYLLMFLVLGGSLSYFLTLKIGKLFAKRFYHIPYTSLVTLTITLVTLLVFVFTGILGLMIFGVATSIGFLPVSWGVRRSHCMGVLLLPVILYFL
jgi:putative membrane protein